jgi:endonuclease-3 related protein
MISLVDTYAALRQHFGTLTGLDAPRPWWPLFSDDQPFEILVGAVLVQQTRWETVEAATLRLIAAGLLTPPALAAADPVELALQIRPAAFHTQKAAGLIAIATYLCERYAGSTAAMLAQPTALLRAELLGLPRIGPETCDVIMLYGGGHPVFVVDEYTRRLFERVDVRSGLSAKGGSTGDEGEPRARKRGEEEANGRGTASEKRPFWRRASYEAMRLAIEAELSGTLSPVPSPLSALFAEYHAQINEACVRYCLARPRCDGPPARRVYSIQQGRENYLDREDGCPLRPVCAYYQSTQATQPTEPIA